MLPITQVKVMTAVGAILVLLCSVFLGVFPVIFNAIVDKMLVVSPSSDTFAAFVTPPIPVYMQIWLYNVTNADDIRFRGAKPKLQQVGPYTYEEIRVKYDFDWSNEGTVSYLQNKTYIFREDMSNGLTESDHITSINVLMVLLSNLFGGVHEYATDNDLDLDELAYFSNDTIGNLLPGIIWTQVESAMDPFETHEAGELLFHGYQLPKFNFDFSDLAVLVPALNDTMGWSGTVGGILEAMGVMDKLPVGVQDFLGDNLLGLMLGANNTNDKRYEVKTGSTGMSDLLNIVSWNGNSALDYWFGAGAKYCNMINGTDGSQYPPRITRESTLMIYTSELCRSLYLTYEKDLYHHGIPVYRFVPPREVLEDPLINHDNLCYCVPDIDHCLGAGMLNMQPCLGIPMVLSTPHFYQGDERELAKVEGLNPSKEDHETTIDVEPRTGVAMYAAKKMQLNVPLKRYGTLPSFSRVPDVIFPILWVNESASVDLESAKEVKNAVVLPFIVVKAICGSLIAVGLLLLLLGAAKFIKIRRSKQQGKI